VKITTSAVSLNVDDVPASSAFLTEHFGFSENMAADGFASLSRDDCGMNVIFLRRGLLTLPADQRDTHVTGLILASLSTTSKGSSPGCGTKGSSSPCRSPSRSGASGPSKSATPTASSCSFSTGTHPPPADSSAATAFRVRLTGVARNHLRHRPRRPPLRIRTRSIFRPEFGHIRDGPVLISFAQVEVSRNPSRN
jgi:hypothetical protein